jgi:hypothetical protein
MKINSVTKTINPESFQPLLNINVDLSLSIEYLQDMKNMNQLDGRSELGKILVDELIEEIDKFNSKIKDCSTCESASMCNP